MLNYKLSSFSNYGEMNVDVAAPGEDITSTLPGNRFGQKSGTSMATPFVSGEAALILSKSKDITAQEIKEKIINSSDRISTLDGKVRRANKINIANALSGIVNDDMVELTAKEVAEESEAANESENTSLNANGEFSTYSGSSLYSDSQEVVSSMFSIPATSVKGTLNTLVKGDTRSNLFKSPEMNKDSDGNGLVDNFIFYKDVYYDNNTATDTATYSFDAAEQCQKLEITKSTSTKGACVFQKFYVLPGDKVKVSYDVKVQGNVKGVVIVSWYNKNGWISSKSSVNYTDTAFNTLEVLNAVVPQNAIQAQLQIWIYPTTAGGTGSVWCKNAVAEWETNGTSFISTGTKSTEPFRVKSVGKNLFSDDMFYNYGTAKVTKGTITIDNNRLKFVSTGDDAFTNTRFSSTAGTISPVSYNKYSFPVTASKMYYTRKIENLTVGKTNEYVYYYDSERKLISYNDVGKNANGTVTSVLTPPANAKYFTIRLGATKSGQTVYFSEFMLSKENIAYEPYKESVAYVPVKLNSLPNGVRDEIDINTGTYIKRTEKVTVGRGAWANTSFNSYYNYDIYEYKLDTTPILPGSIISVDGYNFAYAKGDSADANYYDNWTDEHQSITGNKNIALRFIHDFAAPSEVTIVYQLATPVQTTQPVYQNALNLAGVAP